MLANYVLLTSNVTVALAHRLRGNLMRTLGGVASIMRSIHSGHGFSQQISRRHVTRFRHFTLSFGDLLSRVRR